MVTLRLTPAIFCLLSAVCGMARAEDAPFVKVHEGKHWIWIARQDQYDAHKADIEALYDYADAAFDKLCDDWGLKPPRNQYALLVWDKTGGGFAAGDIGEAHQVTGTATPGIGVSFDAFSGTANGIKAYWAHILMTHEMVNLFTGQVVSGGWPVDWWANHRSPFPLFTAIQIESALVPEMAIYHAKDGMHDPLVVMFIHLKDQYGWHMFQKAFSAAIADGIKWDRIGKNPSPLLTAYVAAYLQIGAPEDISAILAAQVPGYDAAKVRGILRARETWTALPPNSPRRNTLQAAYLKGDYQASLR
jgi:hypothetical protein